MHATKKSRYKIGPIGWALAAVALATPACQAQGWPCWGWGRRTSPYTVYRPPYYGEPTRRALFLGNYSGYNYGRAPHVEPGVAVPAAGTIDTPVQTYRRPLFSRWSAR
jgi:hypothetical protein